ncbi:MAG: helix-turn-helix transcriptional regulator [Acidobacteriota bacterium]
MNKFGKQLRKWREEASLRLIDLAEKMGWSVVYLSDIELGRRNPPTPEKIKELARLLNRRADDLLNLADQEKERVELGLVDKSPHLTEAALMLARSWDGLNDEEAQQIIEILRHKEKNK